MTPERKCENCVYWQQLSGESSSNQGREEVGYCHRYPPKAKWDEYDDDGKSEVVVTESSWWCGEFQAREDGGT